MEKVRPQYKLPPSKRLVDYDLANVSSYFKPTAF